MHPRSTPNVEDPSVLRARLLLGVSPWAREDEIRGALRRKARIHHPDVGGDARAMVEILSARDLLLRSIARRAA